jgi:hypothetical protein
MFRSSDDHLQGAFWSWLKSLVKIWDFKCGYAAADVHSFCLLYCAERHVDLLYCAEGHVDMLNCAERHVDMLYCAEGHVDMLYCAEGHVDMLYCAERHVDMLYCAERHVDMLYCVERHVDSSKHEWWMTKLNRFEKKKTVPAMKTHRGSWRIAPVILNLGARWKCVANVTLRLLYNRGKNSSELKMHGETVDIGYIIYIFISILYIFRTTLFSSSGESIVSIQHLVLPPPQGHLLSCSDFVVLLPRLWL